MTLYDRALRAAAKELKSRPSLQEPSVELTGDERRTIVTIFSTILEGAYAHLPQKRATYGHDPVQRLRALKLRV